VATRLIVGRARRGTMRQLFTACAVLATGLLIATLPAAAQGNSPQLVVSNAVPNLRDQTLMISGWNFGSLPPFVTLGGMPLQLLAISGTQIVAVLPGAAVVTPGSYLLMVLRPQAKVASNAGGARQSEFRDVRRHDRCGGFKGRLRPAGGARTAG
jgi:hypothetical protein